MLDDTLRPPTRCRRRTVAGDDRPWSIQQKVALQRPEEACQDVVSLRALVPRQEPTAAVARAWEAKRIAPEDAS